MTERILGDQELRDKIRSYVNDGLEKTFIATDNLDKKSGVEAVDGVVEALYQLVVESQLKARIREAQGFYNNDERLNEIVKERVSKLQSQLSSIGESK